MTMIYYPIPFVKLVQKILPGNYEPIMGMCGKIFLMYFAQSPNAVHVVNSI